MSAVEWVAVVVWSVVVSVALGILSDELADANRTNALLLAAPIE